MELRLLHSFLVLADELHYGRAAQRLAMAQSPLSRQIMQLEADLGVALFERSRRHVRLTPAGTVFVREAMATLDRVAAARDAVRRAS